MSWLGAAARYAIRGYQYSFAILGWGSCRFYPSCSHYALWSFEVMPWWKALPKALARIGRCNPYHPGGIDYPLVRLPRPGCVRARPRARILYWLVPEPGKSGHYRIIRRLQSLKEP